MAFRLTRWLYAIFWTGTDRPSVLFERATTWLVTHRLSPLLHEHINMLGRYSFSVPDAVAKGELRPLRNPERDE